MGTLQRWVLFGKELLTFNRFPAAGQQLGSLASFNASSTLQTASVQCSWSSALGLPRIGSWAPSSLTDIASRLLAVPKKKVHYVIFCCFVLVHIFTRCHFLLRVQPPSPPPLPHMHFHSLVSKHINRYLHIAKGNVARINIFDSSL